MKEENPLDGIMVAAPCPIAWESMPGDERTRFCNSCQKHVYNLSEMTKDDATEFIRKNGTTKCVRLFRRADGTIITNNCPVGLRLLKRRCSGAIKFVAGLAALFMSFASSAQAQSASQSKDSDCKSPDKPETLRITPGHRAQIVRSTMGHLHAPDSETKCKPNPIATELPNMNIPSYLIEPHMVAPDLDASFDGAGFDPLSQDHVTIGKSGSSQPAELLTAKRGPAGDKGSGIVKLSARYNVVLAEAEKQPMHADVTAITLWQRARTSEEQGKLLLALSQCKDSLKACEQQVEGDVVFRLFLEREVARLQEKVRQMASASK